MPIKLHNATMIAMDQETGETFEIGEPVELEITKEAEEPPQKSIKITNEISGELELSPVSKKLLLRFLFGAMNNDLKRHHMPKRRRYGRVKDSQKSRIWF